MENWWGEEYLSAKEGGTTLGHLQNDGGFQVAGSFESSDDSRGGGHILHSSAIKFLNVQGSNVQWRE